MGAGRFVGRVGGLAVALGVGAAVSLGSGIAWADEGTSGSESGGSSSSSGGASSSSPGTSSPSASEGSSPSSTEAATAGEAKDEVKSTGSSSSHKRKQTSSKAAKKEAAEAPKSSVTSRPVRHTDDDESAPAAASAPAKVKTTPVAVSAPAASAVSDAPSVAPAAAVVAESVRAVSGAVVDASLLGGVPTGPLVNSPVLWVAAAASRREFTGGGKASANAAVVVSTGEPALALAAAATANSNPVITVTPPGAPDALTGVVTGQASATDADGNTLKYTATASKGKVVITATTGGFTFTYTPTAAARHAASATVNPVLSDTIKFTVSDGKGGSAAATASVEIAPVNADPTATYSAGKPSSSSGVVTGTVKGADAEKDKLTYSVTTQATNGLAVIDQATGKFTYAPTALAQLAATPTTTDTFKVTVSDGHGGSVIKDVTVSIAPNQAPTNPSFTITKNDPKSGVVTGTVKATDLDKNALAFSTGAAAKGTVTINPKTGVFTYTPSQEARQAVAEGVAGAETDSFTVTITDSKGATTDPLVVAVTITPNKAPISPDVTGVKSNSSGVVTGKVTATDPDNDALKYGVVSTKTAKGTVKITSSGTFTYTPSAAARHAASSLMAGTADVTDTFTVAITDARGAVTKHDVMVSILAKNAAPTASVTVGKPNAGNGVVTGTVKGADADKDILSYGADATSAKGGTVAINATTGAFIYTPTAAARHSAAGTAAADKTDTFSVTVSDAYNGGVTTKLVTVTVAPTNAAPSGGGFTITNTAPNGVVTGTLSATDADGDTLTYTAASKTSKGAITISGNTFTYTPTDAARVKANGTTAADKVDSFTVTVSDGHTGTTTISVVNVPIAPKGLSTVGTKIVVNGENYDAVMSKDGTRAIIATVTGNGTTGYTTSFTVINTTTGAKIGTAVQVTGQEGWITFSDNASRALVATSVDEVDGTQSTRLAVINAGTGIQLGTTLTLAGYGYVDDVLAFNADQTRAIFAIDGTNNTDDVTRVTVVNLTSGAQAGITRTFVGTQDGDELIGDLSPVSVDLNADGSRIVVTTIGGSSDDLATITIIETTGGTQLGATTSVNGAVYNPVQISNDGTRAVFAYSPAGANTEVVLLNLTTGDQVGATLSAAGLGAAQLSGDSSKLVVNTAAYNAGVNTTYISVYNAATGAQIGASPVSVAGTTTILPAQFNDAGTRAIVTGYNADVTSVRVITIDTATGAQVGATVTVAGLPIGFDPTSGHLPLPIQLVANGTRAVVTTAPTGTTTNYAVINTTTGAQIGSTLNLTGTVIFNVEDTDTYLTPLFNDDDSRAYLTTVTGSTSGGYTTRIALLNTETGAQVGNTIVLTGAPATYVGDSNLVAAGNRAAYFTNVIDSKGNYTTRVAIINTDTGAQLGATRTFTGTYAAYVQISDDNKVTVLADTDTTSKLSVYNAVTGAQIGKTLTFSGSTWTWVTLTTEPNRALAFTVSGTTTKVTAVDLTTATTIGSTLTLPGGLYYVYRDDANDRAVVTFQSGTEQAGYVTTVNTVQVKA